MPSAEDAEKDFWVGITIFGAALGTGLYALVEHEWWFGGLYTIGSLLGFAWMSPAARSAIGFTPSRTVLFSVVAMTLLFLVANIGVSIYDRWNPTPLGDQIIGGPRKFTEPQALKTISGVTFQNETVRLDGMDYQFCTFDNVTFQYDGTATFSFQHNQLIGRVNFESESDSVNATMLMLAGLGATNKFNILNAPPGIHVEPLNRMSGPPPEIK
jgi:hypothetical protein